MTFHVDSRPVARRRHRCLLCSRTIHPGETYWQQSVFDEGSVWAHKTCEHCERVVVTYCRTVGDEEWMEEDVLDWLRDDHPALFAALFMGWWFPDGELLPMPFESRFEREDV